MYYSVTQIEFSLTCIHSAVDMFLKNKSRYISNDAVLLCITPVEISGVKVDQQDQVDSWIPFKYVWQENLPQSSLYFMQAIEWMCITLLEMYTCVLRFRELPHKLPDPALVQRVMPTAYSSWPQRLPARVAHLTPLYYFASTDCVVTTGETKSKIQFHMFTHESSTLAPSTSTGATQGQATATQSQARATQGQASTTASVKLSKQATKDPFEKDESDTCSH